MVVLICKPSQNTERSPHQPNLRKTNDEKQTEALQAIQKHQQKHILHQELKHNKLCRLQGNLQCLVFKKKKKSLQRGQIKH